MSPSAGFNFGISASPEVGATGGSCSGESGFAPPSTHARHASGSSVATVVGPRYLGHRSAPSNASSAYGDRGPAGPAGRGMVSDATGFGSGGYLSPEAALAEGYWEGRPGSGLSQGANGESSGEAD